jgi:hypothetical protein
VNYTPLTAQFNWELSTLPISSPAEEINSGSVPEKELAPLLVSIKARLACNSRRMRENFTHRSPRWIERQSKPIENEVFI